MVQMRIYALGLDYMGFDCSKLRLVIGVEHMDIREKLGFSPYRHDIIFLRILLKEGRQIEELRRDGYRRLVYDYERGEALEEFEWAKDYWLDRRKPKPTKKSWKCKRCEYRDRCPSSLA